MPGHLAASPESKLSTTAVTGLILAGGGGRRLGGIDKGLLELDGEPLVQHVAQRLVGQVGTLLLSANRNLDRYRALGFAPLTDDPYRDAGPLAGLRAGLMACATPWLLAVPCDMPFLPVDLGQRLLQAAPADDPRARVPWDGQRHHYACLLLPRTALAQVETALDSGRRSVRELLHAIGWIGVDFAASDPQAFCNINAPADLAALECPAESP
ncbi:molybdenum cofactor guanylyltransferase MobA [Immundisolibacter sp.]|uniref:molybdenum cofactor guanylyltransferase MobA n=1 Tax=Immundisolibacter sp. TaxID=1934948 RepID=UPI0019BF3705|nr:molybdenum cofactor guanylyltransferase MobA [Immundisolibacter sp.]MBC7160776.1 molybdenum cofactor guanylyltransferase [Immundisolibacter sp.]MEA3219870.1 Molybdenum cofactor guanylyltransferase [Immundisolibacter sp.]